MKDSYNYYLSQLQIRIDQTFGYMMTKWHILQQPLQSKLKNVGKIFLCITCLHNFLNEGNNIPLPGMTDETDSDGEAGNQGYLPLDPSVLLLPGNSMIRDIILNHI